MFVAMLGLAASPEWSYTCFGATVGCILTERNASRQLDGTFPSLSQCQAFCPQIGKQLSYTCTETGNCMLATHQPDGQDYYPSLQACANAPGGKCFAPGSRPISYECHGPHFGCVPKDGKADWNETWPTLAACEDKCHTVPRGFSFVCPFRGATSCVLALGNPFGHDFKTVGECAQWCDWP